MYIRSLLLLILLVFLAQVQAEDGNILCGGCQMGVNFLENKLSKFESVTKGDLDAFAKKVCAKAPKLDLFVVLCTTVRDDVIDIIIKIIEGIEKQIDANHTCKVLGLCTSGK